MKGVVSYFAKMEAIMQYLRDFNIVTVTLRLVLAFLFGGIIGMDRERKGRPAGMRTHILVCLGSSMTTMSGFFVVHTLGIESDPLRISAQVISGIGFLGVGTILITGRMHVKGLTTAAGLWTTASIGIALGAGFYEGALFVYRVVRHCHFSSLSVGKSAWQQNGCH